MRTRAPALQHRRTQEILTAKNRHYQQHKEKEQAKLAQEQVIEHHKEELSRVREERKQALQASKAAATLERQGLARLNKEMALRNADAIAHARAAELNANMYKRNEVRKVEAEARERKLREKELMIAHLQQRAEERQRDESMATSEYDKKLTELEREEYELLCALESHRVCTALRPIVVRMLMSLPLPCAFDACCLVLCCPRSVSVRRSISSWRSRLAAARKQ